MSTLFSVDLLLFAATSFGAVDQSLIDTFYQNLAELSLVNKVQLMAGDLFIAPKLKFTGNAPGGIGSATSSVSDNVRCLQID